MATADRVDSRRRTKHQRTTGERKPKKSHAFRNGCMLMLCLLLALAYFAPAIIAYTSLRHWVVQTVLEPDGTITLGSASLGWFSPVAAGNIDIRDSAGESVVVVESLRSEKSLISLLLDVDDLGRLHVVNPAVHLVAHEKDTNLERVFASLLASDSESSITAELQVTGGTVVIDDAVEKRQYQVNDLAVNCKLGDAAEGILLAASGALAGEQQAANFKVDLNATPSASTGAALANGKVTCETTALPLELLEPLARRAIDRARLSGQASAQLNGAWGDMAKDSAASLEGQVVLAGLQFSAAALGDDQIRLERVELPCRIRQKGDLVEIDEMAVKCEVGQITLSGSAKTSDFSAQNVLAALARENYELKGQVDLARLARMLPATLRIREGTEITSGEVEIAASAKQLASGMSWTGLVETSRLAATAGGRPIAWEQPLAIQFALHEADDAIAIDRAVCTSSFLQVSAAGSLDNLSASADFDLARLVTELRQFSDLNNVQLAGQGRAQLTMKRAAQDQFAADANFQARGFQWITPGSRPWTEENLVARLSVSGKLNGQSLARIDAATLNVESGSDRLQAQLRAAVSEPASAAWPLACSWQGQLAAWAPRLESCLGMAGWDLGGSGTLQATLDASPKSVTIQNAQLNFSQLRVQGNRWFLNEPAVAATCSGKLDVGTQRVDLIAAKVTAGSSVVLVDHAVLQPASAGWSLDGGNAHVEADLAQLARWRQDPRTAGAWQVAGKLTGDAQLKHSEGATDGKLDAAIDRLQIVDAARPAPGAVPTAVWQEQRLTLAARGNYRHADGQLKLDTVQVASGALRLDAKGAVAAGTTGGNVDVQGTVAYDWEKLAPLWRPYLGDEFQIAGRQTREFAVRGQLSGPPTSLDSWKNVTGNAGIGWTGMSVHGLRVGQGDISAQLADGLVRTQPIAMDVSEGRLTISPVARISPAPAEVHLPVGPLLTDVRLSPQMCAKGLRFIAPILADATVAEGTFSITLDGGRIPLADPGAGDIGGRMKMQGNIKPGPVSQEFVGLIKELVTIVRRGSLPSGDLDGSLMSIDNSNVEFRMVNRRVYHRGMTIVVGTTPITTEGSVGLDETLSLVAQVPINARLLGADLSLGTLEGKSIKIPIAGTLSKPKLDRRALQDIPRQLIENAARDVLTDGLNKGLERLFPSQP